MQWVIMNLWTALAVLNIQDFRMSLYKAELKIKKIMMKCEENGTGFNEMFNKLRSVKCYGDTFSSVMLMNMAEEFIKSHKERNEKPDLGNMQEKWDEAEVAWNTKEFCGN